MSKLDELIRELCPNGVEFKFLGDVSINKDSLRKPITSDKRVAGDYPYYGASGIVDYINEYIFDGDYLLVSEDGANLLSRNTPIAFSISGKNWVNNHAHVLEFNTEAERKFIEYYLNSINLEPYISGSAQPKLNQKNLNIIRVPAPPLEVQQEIVRLLDDFTAKTAELQNKIHEELEARKKQYEYQKEKLLTHNNDAITYTISELCSVSAGGDAPKNAMSKEITKEYTIPIISNGIRENAIYGYTNKARICEPAVTLAARGTIGYAEYRDYPYVPIIRLLNLIPKNTQVLDTKYLYYCLTDKKYTLPTTGIPQLTAPMVKKIEISVPKIEIQKEIVKILDEYNIFYRDLQDNLNNEIESRQKQYEFYRDKLLTFKELK